MKLSTTTNRFPHTFSKARALECNYSVNVTRPCPASSDIAPLEKTNERAHLFSPQCAFMASTESEDWTVEEDGEPAGEPVASTTSARATSSDREEEEEDDEEMADEGYGVEEEEQQQQEEAALGSPEEVRVAAASEEDSDLVQTETTEGEDGYEAAEEDEQDTLDLDEEEGEGERSGEVDSQVEAASEGEWDYGDGERDEAFVGEATPEPASPAAASPQGEGEGGGEAVVTQRDEEIENYQSTVKELTAAVIEREQKIGAHQLESTAAVSCIR